MSDDDNVIHLDPITDEDRAEVEQLGRDATLEELRHVAGKRREWEEALVACVQAAMRAPGVTVTDIAEACGVTRQTIYRWANTVSEPVRRYVSTARVLDDAMHALLAAGVGQAAAADISAALRSTDLRIKAERMVRGVRGLPSPLGTVEADLRAAIERGTEAASAVASAAGDPPKRVRVSFS